MKRILREITTNQAVRFGMLVGFGVFLAVWYWLSTLQICSATRCYGYTTHYFWSAILMKTAYYYGLPILIGAAIGWLSFDWRWWLGTTAVLILAASFLRLVPPPSEAKSLQTRSEAPPAVEAPPGFVDLDQYMREHPNTVGKPF